MNMRRDLLEPPEILTRTNWKSWKIDIEKHARKEGVWKYCDPDAPEKYYPELYEPEKPHVSTVRPEAESIVDLGEDDLIELSSVVNLYWKQMHVYEKIHLIEYAQTPLEQMIALSVKFKKSRLEDLQPRWERIQKLASKVEVQELFELWNALFTDCDGYLSGNARNQDAFWECVETAGYSSGNCFPLTSQHWIEIPDNVESRNYGDACAQPPSLIKRESIASQHWIQTTDTVNYGNGCARPRSPAKREFIDSPYYVSDCEPTVSIGHASLSPQPGSMADRGDQRGAVSGDDLDKW